MSFAVYFLTPRMLLHSERRFTMCFDEAREAPTSSGRVSHTMKSTGLCMNLHQSESCTLRSSTYIFSRVVDVPGELEDMS